MRVVLDTNVLARAAYRLEGPAAYALERVCTPPHQLILSPPILEELHRVLLYPRLRSLHQLSDEAIAVFLGQLSRQALVVDVGPEPSASVIDPDDAQVLATAVTGRADAICTLDRHFYRAAVLEFCRERGIEISDDVGLISKLDYR
jgi:putative PIN family toxin of toxin-antitoxin system